MSNSFSAKDAETLLVACHRRCCVCHRFCGVKMEIDHIVPAAEGGPSTAENGIPVCFECHAEIHSYNDKHPRGRKFRPDELRLHKEQWLEICKKQPQVFNAKVLSAEVGPLQALIDELEFNLALAAENANGPRGCLFLEEQFRKAISQGSIAILRDELKKLLVQAYIAIGAAKLQRRRRSSVAAPLKTRIPRSSVFWHRKANNSAKTLKAVLPRPDLCATVTGSSPAAPKIQEVPQRPKVAPRQRSGNIAGCARPDALGCK